jgi:AraC family transcriptional regulator
MHPAGTPVPQTLEGLADAPAVDLQRLSQLGQQMPLSAAAWLHASTALLPADGGPLTLFDASGAWPGPYVPPLDRHLVGVALAPVPGCMSWLAGEGLQLRALPAGACFLLPAGEAAFLQLPAPQALLVLALSPRLLVAAQGRGQGLAPAQLHACSVASDAVVHGLALTLQAAAQRGGPHLGPVVDHLARALAAQLLAQHATRAPLERAGLGHVRLERALAFLNSRIAHEVDLAEAAQVAGCSLHHFAHLFKASMGTSPMRYLRQLRMQRARELVETTRLSMAEIGEQVGLPDPARFSQAFRAHWRVSPSALRRPA